MIQQIYSRQSYMNPRIIPQNKPVLKDIRGRNNPREMSMP